MATAQFTGDSGKSLTLYIGDRTVVLIGVGETVAPGAEAEAVGGRIMSAVGACSQAGLSSGPGRC